MDFTSEFEKPPTEEPAFTVKKLKEKLGTQIQDAVFCSHLGVDVEDSEIYEPLTTGDYKSKSIEVYEGKLLGGYLPRPIPMQTCVNVSDRGILKAVGKSPEKYNVVKIDKDKFYVLKNGLILLNRIKEKEYWITKKENKEEALKTEKTDSKFNCNVTEGNLVKVFKEPYKLVIAFHDKRHEVLELCSKQQTFGDILTKLRLTYTLAEVQFRGSDAKELDGPTVPESFFRTTDDPVTRLRGDYVLQIVPKKYADSIMSYSIVSEKELNLKGLLECNKATEVKKLQEKVKKDYEHLISPDLKKFLMNGILVCSDKSNKASGKGLLVRAASHRIKSSEKLEATEKVQDHFPSLISFTLYVKKCQSKLNNVKWIDSLVCSKEKAGIEEECGSVNSGTF